VNYLLSPEHLYPAPQDDFAQVYPVMLELYGKHRLVLSGESAGGNQVLSLLHRARKQSLALPACAALFSPWLDLAHQGNSHIFNDTRDPSLNTAWVDAAARMHANGFPLDDPGISPIHGDMTGLPPIITTTGSCELLLSDSLRLAQKLREAGVICDLRVWEGMWHVFEYYPIPEAEASLKEVAEFVQMHCR
jgi:monoterpene epsilon-lactone hydrolase